MSEHNQPVYVRIGVEEKQVMLLFCKDPEGSIPSNISKWMVDPAQCLEISEGMATAAFEADTSLRPVGPALKATLMENHRIKLTARVALMLTTLRGDKLKTDGMVARDIVDAMLKEVFS